MSKDLHPIDDLFRTGLNGKEETPTPAVWEAIEKELDKKDRKPIGGFFRMSGRAAIVALIIISGATLFAAGYFIRDAQDEKKGIGQGALGTEGGKGTGQGALGTEGETVEMSEDAEKQKPGSSSPTNAEPVKSTPDQLNTSGISPSVEKIVVERNKKQQPKTNTKAKTSSSGASSETLPSSSISEPVNPERQEQQITWEMARTLPSVKEHLLPESSIKIPVNDAVIGRITSAWIFSHPLRGISKP